MQSDLLPVGTLDAQLDVGLGGGTLPVVQYGVQSYDAVLHSRLIQRDLLLQVLQVLLHNTLQGGMVPGVCELANSKGAGLVVVLLWLQWSGHPAHWFRFPRAAFYLEMSLGKQTPACTLMTCMCSV